MIIEQTYFIDITCLNIYDKHYQKEHTKCFFLLIIEFIQKMIVLN